MEGISHTTNKGSKSTSQEGVGIAGVNLGFGFCKLVLDRQEDSYMSVLTPLNKGLAGVQTRTVLPVNVIEDEDGQQYEAGIHGVFSRRQEPLKVLKRDWGRSKHYRLLMGTVLNRMAATGKRRWLIATGLAADHYRDVVYREEIAKLWKGVNGCHHTRFGVVEVQAVRVLPETAGGFFELMAHPESNAMVRAASGAIVDFGRMTVNWLPFRSEEVDGDGLGSVDVGVSGVIAEATTLVRSEARNPNLHPLEVEAAILGVRPIFKVFNGPDAPPTRDPVSLDIALTKSVAAVWPRIEQALTHNLGDLRGQLLIGIGGGARLFGGMLRDSFSETAVFLPEDSQMANARGLYRMARTTAGLKQEASL